MADVVTDASALVDLLLARDLGQAVAGRLAGHRMHAPAHVDSEVLSALGRLQRAGRLPAEDVAAGLASLASAPITRHPLSELILGAWERRHHLRLADALYVHLATTLGCPLVTTDRRLHDVPGADIVTT